MEFETFERVDHFADAVMITDENMAQVRDLVGYKIVEKTALVSGRKYNAILLNTQKARSGKKSYAYVGDWLVVDQRGLFRVYGSRKFVEKFKPCRNKKSPTNKEKRWWQRSK